MVTDRLGTNQSARPAKIRTRNPEHSDCSFARYGRHPLPNPDSVVFPYRPLPNHCIASFADASSTTFQHTHSFYGFRACRDQLSTAMIPAAASYPSRNSEAEPFPKADLAPWAWKRHHLRPRSPVHSVSALTCMQYVLFNFFTTKCHPPS